MKSLIIGALIFVLTNIDVSAQEKYESGSPVSIEQINNPGIENHNSAVQQFGLDFFLTLTPLDPLGSQAGQGNTGSISIFGSNNTADLSQSGSSNSGVIQIGAPDNFVLGNNIFVNQDGQQLRSITDIQGNQNEFNFLQQGTNVGAAIFFRGDNLQFDARQFGSDFQLTPSGSSLPAVNISTTRQTLPVIISNN